MLDHLRIKTKLSLMSFVILFIAFGVLISTSFIQTMNLAGKDSETISESNRLHYSSYIEGLFERAIYENINIRDTVEVIIEAKNSNVRDVITTSMVEWFKSNETLLDTFTITEANVIDGRDEEYKNTDRYGSTGAFSAWISEDVDGSTGIYPSVLSGDPVADEWYHIPAGRRKTTISEPYEFEYTSGLKTIVTISEPLRNKSGNFLGIIGCDFEVGSLDSIIGEITIYESGYINVFSEAGTIIVSKNDDWLGKNIDDVEIYNSGILEDIHSKREFSQEVDGMLISGGPIDFADSGQKWFITINIPIKEINRDATNIFIRILVIGIISFILIGVLIILFSNSISKPIVDITEFAQVLADGDFTREIDSNQASIEITHLKDSLENMKVKLSNVICQVKDNSLYIANSSRELALGNNDLANRTEQQAASLEETSAAIEEMNASIKANADNTKEAANLSNDALEKTLEGAKAVKSVINSMGEISSSSNRIANIIEVINNIAFQTNLLALNASIEAARAGEMGKGFAVVAVEVRKLAKKSDRAAAEITEIIKSSNTKVEDGVVIAQDAGEVLDKINQVVNKVNTIISEISSSSQQQLVSAEEIDRSLVNLDENTQKNAALVEESAVSTGQLSHKAEELTNTVDYFELDEDRKLLE